MKKGLLPLLLLLSGLLWAEIDAIDGVGLNTNFSSTVYSDTDANGDTISASSSRLFLQPSLHYFLDEETEFIPYLTYGITWESNPDDMNRDKAGTYTDETYRNYLGLGASLLWHFLHTWRVDFVTGMRGDMVFGLNEVGKGAPTGEAWDPKSFLFDISGSVPLAMDFILTRDFRLRLSTDLVRIGYSYYEEKDEDSKMTDGTFQSTFPFLDDSNMARVSLAAIYYLGE